MNALDVARSTVLALAVRSSVAFAADPAIDPALARAWFAEAQELAVHLAGEGEIVRLTDDLAYTCGQLERLEAEVGRVLAAKGLLTVADFKEATGVSRKYAVPLLEYLDGRGVTRRSGVNRLPGKLLASRERMG